MRAQYETNFNVESGFGASLTEMRRLLAKGALGPLAPVIERIFLSDLGTLCDTLACFPSGNFRELLNAFGIRYECEADDVRRIPSQGPVIVVANHPFGLAEGAILGALLSEMRPDFRFLANHMLQSVPQLRSYVIPVNPYGGADAVRENRKALAESIRWVRTGGLLVAFPAGDVSTFHFPQWGIADCEWTHTAVRLAQRTGASVLPVFFHGTNSPAFHAAGMIHPRLKTALLPREFLNKHRESVKVSIGNLVRPDRLIHLTGAAATSYLRGRTLLLEARDDRTSKHHRFSFPLFPAKPADLAGAQDPREMEREIDFLPPEQLLITSGEYSVCVAASLQIPSVLQEIGRLREVTFRNAGEGTGKAHDLDRHDDHYEHLFLWNQQKREIVGAYRIGRTDQILPQRGIRALYTSSLFHLEPQFYSAIEPALELGRSFVRPEYQKHYLPLLMLWKGLGHFVAAAPRYRILFGPVSISNNYSPESRALIVSFLKMRHRNQQLSGYVRPRHKFRIPNLPECHPSNFSCLLENLDELSEVIADLESDHKGLPILLQHYLNLGGQMLEFSVDAKFSNVLDALVVVDLAQSNRRQLERYMGRDKAKEYLEYHGIR